MKENGNGDCIEVMEFNRALDMAAVVGAIATECKRDDGSIVYVIFCTRAGLSDAKAMLHLIERQVD